MAGSGRNLTKDAKETRERLLNAAEELFAEKGLDGISIRELITKANCNLSAVNYYFGDKKELYEELFRQRLREMRDTRLSAIQNAMKARARPTLEKLLHTYAVAFLEPFADFERSQRFLHLFSRELVEQRLPRDFFVEEMAGPVMAALENAIITLCPDLDKRNAQMSVHSVVAQLVHIIHLRIILGVEQSHLATNSDIERAIDHIVKFSAAGIRACEKGKE